eukprot:TRINITY_DN6772_c0_g1_i1.p1 TRINITY_DN6772_c0_g1~~TRINITY_DN6772_c0_g1_i1.p1  ORF type:complete len:592 (-),score=195.33 TRINITY_DN6772_c0_g1_i1:16-1791(-)
MEIESTASSSSSSSSLYDQLWNEVNSNPSNFEGWTRLLAEVQSHQIQDIRKCYDTFLALFPLCFGYWKTYADLEMAQGLVTQQTADGLGKDEQEKKYRDALDMTVQILERGCKATKHSVEMWLNYISFCIDRKLSDDHTRDVFERALEALEFDWNCSQVWDKYLEFEHVRGNNAAVVRLYTRLLSVACAGLPTYHHQYKTLANNVGLMDLASKEEIQQFRDSAMQEMEERGAIEGKDPELIEERIGAMIRIRIFDERLHQYQKTQMDTQKRQNFEQFINRTYFHVTPVPEDQLRNWRKYLSFEEVEEAMGMHDSRRTKKLFERCLVVCAYYPEFWLRYITYLTSIGDVETTKETLERATTLYLTGNADLFLALAEFQESQGDVDGARDSYVRVMKTLSPGHINGTYQYAGFERRQNNLEEAQKVFEETLSLLASKDQASSSNQQQQQQVNNLNFAANKRSFAQVSVKFAKFATSNKLDVDVADILQKAIDMCPMDPEAYIALLEHLCKEEKFDAMNQLYETALADEQTSQLSETDKRTVLEHRIEYEEQYGTDVAVLRVLKATFSKKFGVNAVKIGTTIPMGTAWKRPRME